MSIDSFSPEAGGGFIDMKESKRAILQNMKCHHWSGDLLVKEKGCHHRLRWGEAAKTLSYKPNYVKMTLKQKVKKNRGYTKIKNKPIK